MAYLFNPKPEKKSGGNFAKNPALIILYIYII
jgi:hypothetical protein